MDSQSREYEIKMPEEEEEKKFKDEDWEDYEG